MREVRVPHGPVTLFAVDQGEGPAIVLLHGGLASHEAVLPLVRPLVRRYRVVTPDLRGSGRSRCSDVLTFDALADDVLRLVDHLGLEEVVVGGVSSGSGTAVRFALRFPDRTRALIMAAPVHGGRELGYTSSQQAAFSGMDALASRAAREGIEVLKPMFDALPEGVRERAWAIASGFDPGSVVATSRFIASGAQPFPSGRALGEIRMPTLLIRGDDDQHPAEVSDVYATWIADCTVQPARGVDVASAILDFCDRVRGG